MTRKRTGSRGVTLLETVVATAIAAGVMGTAIGLYVKGTSGFFNEQGRSYMQFRTRSVIDRIATESRGASGFLTTATIGGTTYTASAGPSPAACMILTVPSQDAYGLMYYGAGTATPNALVTDTIVYYFNSSDSTLRRTVSPAVSVVTNDAHTPRTSYRPAEKGTIVARNINQFTLKLKDRDGSLVAASAGARIASIDFQTQVLNTGKRTSESPVSVSGVRLRNMRSGSIPGTVMRSSLGVANAVVKATYTSTSGAYPAGTIVATTTSDSSGRFELYGLVGGTYSVTATPTSGTAATITGIVVATESAANAVTVTVS